MQTERATRAASRAWTTGLAFLGVAALIAVLSVTAADPDLWGHLRFGLDILRERAIEQPDPYSYLTSGQRWINHEWLSEVLFALAWTAGGAAGLVALKLAVALATSSLLIRHLLSLGLHPVRVTILFVLLGAPLLIPYFFLVRPQIFTYLLFAATLLLIRRAEAGEYRWLWLTPPLLALWINLHGGVLAGCGMLVLWACLHLPFHWHARWKVLAPACVSLAALVANPYGTDLLVFLLTTATVPRPEIVEWQPLQLFSSAGLLYAVVLVPAAAAIVLGQPARERRALLGLFALTALLPLLSVRHLPLFSIAAIVFAGPSVAEGWLRIIGRDAQPAAAPASRWAAALPVAAGVAVLALAYERNFLTRVHMTPGFACPTAAVELLARSGVSGHLMLEFGWGEYALWHLAPRIKVGMDGRRETVYSDHAYELYVDFHRGTGDWEAVLKLAPTDFVLVENGTPRRNLLQLHPDWSPVYEDSLSTLFVHRDSVAAPALRATAARFVAPPPKTFFP